MPGFSMSDTPEQLKPLGGKRKAFVEAYCGTARFNATEAARIAGYKDPGNEGWRLRKNADIRAHIDEFLTEHSLTATEILHELTDVAMRDLDEEVEVRRFGKDDNGDPILSARMDASAKLKALELLGKHQVLFTDKRELAGPDGSALRIEVVYADLDVDTDESGN